MKNIVVLLVVLFVLTGCASSPYSEKTEFNRLYVSDDGYIIGHYTGMMRNAIPNSWGRISFNDGREITGRFRGGVISGPVRIRYTKDNAVTYLYAPNGICGDWGVAGIKYATGERVFPSNIKGCGGRVKGASFSDKLVALGDHPNYSISGYIAKGELESWSQYDYKDSFKYFMYYPKTSKVVLSLGDHLTKSRYDVIKENGRIRSCSGGVEDYQCKHSYLNNGGLLIPGGGFGYAPLTKYISPLGNNLGAMIGDWQQTSVNKINIETFQNRWPIFSEAVPQTTVVKYPDGGLFVGEMEDGSREGFGYERNQERKEIWGHYHNNKLEGVAVVQWPNGERHHVMYKHGKKHGLLVKSTSPPLPRTKIYLAAPDTLNRPFDAVAALADQFDQRYETDESSARKFAKQSLVSSLSQIRLPSDESYLDAYRTVLPNNWEKFYFQNSRTIKPVISNRIKEFLERDPLAAQYVALAYSRRYLDAPYQLTIKENNPYTYEQWRDGQLVSTEPMNNWVECTLLGSSYYFPISMKKRLDWAEDIDKVSLSKDRWMVPARLCVAGKVNGQGSALTRNGHWAASGTFRNGSLVSGQKHALSREAFGVSVTIDEQRSTGFGYSMRAVNDGNATKPQYFRGIFNRGPSHKTGQTYKDGRTKKGTFVNGTLRGEATVATSIYVKKTNFVKTWGESGPFTAMVVRAFGERKNELKLVSLSGSHSAGRLTGSYQAVREDGLVLQDYNHTSNGINGIVRYEVPTPMDYSHVIDLSTATGSTWGPDSPPPDAIAYSAVDSADLFDPGFLKTPKTYLREVTLKNSKATRLVETTHQGELLFEGSPLRFGNYKNYNNFEVSRYKGKCNFFSMMEDCQYTNSLPPTRIDPIGKQRKAKYKRLIELWQRKDAALSQAKLEAEAEEKRIKEARAQRDRDRAKALARERAEDKRRARQSDAKLFSQTFGDISGLSVTTGNDINDPLNPNNPINVRMRQQVQNNIQSHYNKQAEMKQAYQQELAARQSDARKPYRQKESSQVSGGYEQRLSGKSSVRTQQPQSTHKPFMTSTIADESATGIDGWDCINNWRASKCGDRIVTHTIHPLAPGYTGNTDGNAAPSDGSQQIDSLSGTSERSNSSDSNNTRETNDDSTLPKPKSQAEAYAVCKIGSCGKWLCEGPLQGPGFCGNGSETLLQELDSTCNSKVNDSLSLGAKLSQGSDKDWVKYSCGHTCGDAVINIASYKERLDKRGFNLPNGCY